MDAKYADLKIQTFAEKLGKEISEKERLEMQLRQLKIDAKQQEKMFQYFGCGIIIAILIIVISRVMLSSGPQLIYVDPRAFQPRP